MHVLVAILGVLGLGAFWYYRMKSVSGAAEEIIDVAERARGAFRRKRFKNKAEAATIDAIKDPRTAATVLLVAIASADGRMSDKTEAAIREAMKTVEVEKPEEELIFAKWAAADVVDLNNLVSRLGRVWVEKLDLDERRQLYELAVRIASVEREPDDLMLSALQRLRDRLGLATPRPA
jgi:uncharacterized tellurite resistance protein B-like protein